MDSQRTHRHVFPLACMVAVAILFDSAAHATAPSYPFPWESENSVRAALLQQEGQTVVCEATVAKIAARNNPPYFVLKDEWRSNSEPESRIVVMCRPPVNLAGVIRVKGTLGRLPNDEPCILNPVTEVLFDAQGRPILWTPFPGFPALGNWQVLPVPTGAIPPSDPSFASIDCGMGIPGEVSAYMTQRVSQFDAVASLLATDPSVLSPVELSAKPIVSVGDGYIIVGDDNSDAAVKVYTHAAARQTDRLIKLTGVVHSEEGQLVLYAGNGTLPFFDSQGSDAGGGVSLAGVGTVAYAATLSDANADEEQSGGFRIMSVSSPTTSDGSWVYLTGQIINYVDGYYSYAVSPPSWVNVYNIQGLDRTPGIRVWRANSSVSAGYVVDVMAKLDTKDGQRILGIVDTTSPYDYSSVECKVLNTNTSNRTAPVGMNNRDLGGTTIGNNPGVTDGYGLYNIGSYLTVWGKVLEKGTYRFDQYGYYIKPYMRVDDGSGVLSGNCNPSYGGPYGSDGVIVFGTNSYATYPNTINIGDYVSATGVSSVWNPNGSTDTYRSIWTSNYAVNLTATPTTRQVLNTGTITGTVKLYDMPDDEANVQVFCTSGDCATLTITRDPDGSGSAIYSFTNIPRTVLVGGYDNYPTYAVSAKCDGFKTRTHTNIAPGAGSGTTRNIYVVPLRKIYLTASSYSIGSCPGQSTTVTATVRDSDHNLVSGVNVRFRTDKGSFDSGSVVRTATATTVNGIATATLCPVLASGEFGSATVEATDDSAPLAGDNTNDDPYKFDWEPLASTLSINAPPVSVTLTATPSKIRRCTEYSTITARVTYCNGTPAPTGTPVNLTVYSPGIFENGSTSAIVNTDADGYATVRVRSNNNAVGTASVYASAAVYEIAGNGNISITIAEFSPSVVASANPNTISGPADSQITFTATNPDGTARVGLPMTIDTTAGSFVGYSNPVNLSTGADGKIVLTLHLDSAQTAIVRTIYTDDCLGTLTAGTQVFYRQHRWQGISVNYSCPLVADLVPGDNEANEVAVISHRRLSGGSWYSDGKAYVWKANGSLAWTSKNKDGQDLVIDSYGDNTLSAADIDSNAESGNAHLELIAPAEPRVPVAGKYRGQVFAFGYDSDSLTLKPMAGWPALTYGYQFQKVAAAIGDANLDGALETIAGDYCCYVYSWNPTGNWNPTLNWVPPGNSYLWQQITGLSSTDIVGSSVALGDVNSFADQNRMPDAVVGSYFDSYELFAFCGDQWGDTNCYPTDWLPQNMGGYDTTYDIGSSPAIGLIDADNENDVVVGDKGGRLYLWLSSSRTWTGYQLASSSYPITSSPVIVELNGQRCIVVGCDNGRLFAVKSDGTPITGWPSDGIRLNATGDYKVVASPAVGDVMNTGSPQIVVGCTDGNVYALWPDGNNHAGGPVAKVWTCAQASGVYVNSTPTICSLDGTQVSLIVGSTDGIYKIGLYSLQQGETFIPGNARWPWPTFHRDNARTGCTTAPAGPVSASIMGTVTLGGNPVPLAKISIRTLGGQSVPVQGRSATRTDPVRSVGDATANNEINEGAYCINQLPPNTTYRITASDANDEHSTTFDVAVTTGMTRTDISLPE